MTGALAGLRVLEVGETTPTAFCAKLLADLGAEVLKVETAGRGDPARAQGPFPPGRESPDTSARFVYLNTGKSSVALDRTTDEGQAALAALVEVADVVIDDGPAGAAGDLAPLVPDRAVWCSITRWGLTGPRRDDRAHHLNLFHAGGEGYLQPSGEAHTLFPERAPTQIGSDVGEFDAGANAAVAVLGACYRQVGTGHGARLDVSIHESLVALARTRLVRITHDGLVMHRMGNPYPAVGGIYPCRDGWVQIMGQRDENWQALGRVSGAEALADPRFATRPGRTEAATDLRARLSEWCEAQDKADVVRVLAEIGFAVGAYTRPQDLLSSPQLQHRGFFRTVDQPELGPVALPGPPYLLSATPAELRPAPRLGEGPGFTPRLRPAAPDGEPGLPLAGVRLLDFSWAIAGPYTTLLLSMLGAEVIKVESSGRLDVGRHGFGGIDYSGVNKAPDFNALNLNKRSLGLDLGQPRALELVRRLLPLCDVVVDNFRPGVMGRLGLGAEQLLADHPGLVVASSSGNGATGPEALYAGLASIFAATGGVSELTGYPDAPPAQIGESPDYRSGVLFALAILAALIHRRRTGEGQAIDLASREVATCLTPDAVLAHVVGAEPLGRMGNRHLTMAPHNVYPSVGDDQWVSIAVGSDEEWAALAAALGRDEWVAAYPDAAARKASEDLIDATIAAWTALRSPFEAAEELQAVGVPAAPSCSNAAIAADAHLAARGAFLEVDHPELGLQRVLGPPWRFQGARVWRHAPLLGQDTGYVLGEVLGLDEAEQSTYRDVVE